MSSTAEEMGRHNVRNSGSATAAAPWFRESNTSLVPLPHDVTALPYLPWNNTSHSPAFVKRHSNYMDNETQFPEPTILRSEMQFSPGSSAGVSSQTSTIRASHTRRKSRTTTKESSKRRPDSKLSDNFHSADLNHARSNTWVSGFERIIKVFKL